MVMALCDFDEGVQERAGFYFSIPGMLVAFQELFALVAEVSIKHIEFDGDAMHSEKRLQPVSIGIATDAQTAGYLAQVLVLYVSLE